MATVYLINCRDAGVDCDFQARGSSLDEAMQICADHAIQQHDMKGFGRELYTKMRGCVRTLEEEATAPPDLKLEAERVRPAVVVRGESLRRLAVVVVEEPEPEIPVSRQVEVQIEPIGQPVPIGNRQAGIVREPGDEVGDLQLLGHELRAEIGLCRVLRGQRRVRVVLIGPRQSPAERQVLRRRARQVSPASATDRRPQIQALLFAVQELLGRVGVPAAPSRRRKSFPRSHRWVSGAFSCELLKMLAKSDIDVALVAVGEVRPERELFRRVRPRHAVTEVQGRVEPRPERPLERLHRRHVGQLHARVRRSARPASSSGSGVNEPVTRLPSNVSTRNCRLLSIEAILLPLDLEIGIRIVRLERQHVLFDALDLTHQPVAAGSDHHVLLAYATPALPMNTASQRIAAPVVMKPRWSAAVPRLPILSSIAS